MLHDAIGPEPLERATIGALPIPESEKAKEGFPGSLLEMVAIADLDPSVVGAKAILKTPLDEAAMLEGGCWVITNFEASVPESDTAPPPRVSAELPTFWIVKVASLCVR